MESENNSKNSFTESRLAKIQETINHMVHWREANSKILPGLLIETLIMRCIIGLSVGYQNSLTGTQHKMVTS
ncbi:hypothetical protein [Sporomusa sp. KB1]|jgi:hypothetical protein|uniref:hypothetical protein n=1 Tax=Sporomusa sp. KB1 TaxID=943346 RepID=UPI0011A47F98|nr:hypothetical protein [Sporomusa sp. KB1]